MAVPPFYDDVILPDEFAPGIVVSLDWTVQIKRRESGVELRRLRGEQPGATIDVEYDAGRNDLIRSLQRLYNAVAGPYAGFLALDPLDFEVPFAGGDPQLLGVGDDSEDEFQLIKTYTFGSRTRDRIIKKPIDGTIVLGIDDGGGIDTIVEDVDYTIDYTTGLITLTDPLPMSHELFCTEGEHYIPVRFRDRLPFRAGSSPTNIKTENFTLVGLILP